MHTPKGEDTNTCLAQLRETCSYEAAVLFVRSWSIKEVAGLDEEVNALAYGKIGYLLKGMTQALSSLFTFAV
jgi:hypothetical protein